jgi:hypothetical protein
MMNAIAGFFKYSALVLTILVLSHIIQVKGVTISQHVENGMNWVSGSRSNAGLTTITRQFSSANSREDNRKLEDADGVSNTDKKELDGVIKHSIRFRK